MKPKQFFYGVLGAIGVTVAAAGGGYYYALTQLHTRSDAQAAALAEQRDAESQINALTSLQHEYNQDIVPILPLIDEALPRDKKQTEILAQLQNIASSSGLQIASLNMPSPAGLPGSVSQTVAAGAVLALPISFQLSGTYTQLQTFTSRVENLNRFTDITTLTITHPDKTQPIIYSMSINAYIKP